MLRGTWMHLILLCVHSPFPNQAVHDQALGGAPSNLDVLLRLRGGNEVASSARAQATCVLSPQPAAENYELTHHDGREVLIVPTDFTNVDEAVENCHAGDRLFVRSGAYQWHGMAVAHGGFEVTGEEEACLLGRWLLSSGKGGLFRGVSCAYRLAVDAVLEHACITAYTSEWNMLDSEFRSVGTTCLRLIEKASLSLQRCNIGGLEPADSFLAKNAIEATHSSRCTLSSCGIDDTGDPFSRPPRSRRGRLLRTAEKDDLFVGGGVRALDKAQVQLQQCRFSNNDIALHVADAAAVTLSRCTIQSGEFACFSASKDATGSRLELWSTKLTGPLWLDEQRPAALLGDHEELMKDADADRSSHDSKGRELPQRRRARRERREQPRCDEQTAELLARHRVQARYDDDGCLVVPPELVQDDDDLDGPAEEEAGERAGSLADNPRRAGIAGGAGEGLDSSASGHWGVEEERKQEEC